MNAVTTTTHNNAVAIGDIAQTWLDNTNTSLIVTSDTIWGFHWAINNRFSVDQPNGCKDLYLSQYADTIITHCGRNRAMAVEVLHCMTLSSSVIGVKNGINYAVRDILSDKNLMQRFIEQNLEDFGCCSGGRFPRHQVSHGAELTNSNMNQSLHNLNQIIDEANSNNNTQQINKKIASPLNKGGVYGAGELLAHEMFGVMLLSGLVTNDAHYDNVEISKGTKTDDRLAERGIKTTEEKEYLLTYISNRFSVSRATAENTVCEALRYVTGNGNRAMDTIDRYGRLYIYDHVNSIIIKFDMDGTFDDSFQFPDWKLPTSAHVHQGARWWIANYKEEYSDEMEGTNILSNRQR